MNLRTSWLILPCLIIFLIGSVYLFIPRELVVGVNALTRCNLSGGFRRIGEDDSWREWWPGERTSYSYRLGRNVYPEVEVILKRGNDSLRTVVNLLAAGLNDSVVIVWKTALDGGMTPWSRIRAYQQGVRLRDSLDLLAASLAAYLRQGEHIYGMNVREVMLLDSCLVVTQISTPAYPSVAEVYGAIGGIRRYIASQGAKETDHPMLHVAHRRDSVYESMIAVPTNRELKGSGRLQIMNFVPWKVLTAEVRGGPHTAERAMNQLQFYVMDHQKTAMAMAFQSLVTERDKVPDTSRWVTRVVQPVP